MSIKNPYIEEPCWKREANAFSKGVKAAVQYLEGKCIEHYSVFKSSSKPMYGHEGQFFMLHRKDCPDCMKQIHEELKQ